MTEFDSNHIEDIKTSMFIEASAGTGKTYTITKIIKKLLSQGIKLDELLVVTYTEKATGELRDRIRKECPDQEVDSASIFTIHSFCQKVLSEFAFTANQNQTLSVIADEALADFVDYWIRNELINDKEFKELFECAEKQDTFIEWITDSFKNSIKNYYLNSNEEEDCSIVSINEEYTYVNRKKNVVIDHIYTYQEIDRLLELHDADPQASDNLLPYILKKDKEIADYKKARFIRNQLKKIYLAWQQEKEKNKWLSYEDMLRKVREAVCNPQLRFKEQLRRKYKIAIIDEFQDTNQKQWDIFKNIFMGDDEHKIIVVGDPKQSIYSFQGADVNVYRNAVNAIVESGGKAFSLSTNFRSTNEMVLACNLLFKKKENSDIRFFDENSHIDFNESNPSGKIETAQYDGKNIKPFWIAGDLDERVDSYDFARIAVQQIIDCCTIKNKKTRLQIFDKNKKEMRNVTFHDFAILARTSTEMPDIEYALQKSGIPFLRYKDKNLFAGIECKNWISLFRAIISKDFTGYRRPILSEALFSVFFNISIEEVENEKFDNPLCEERQKIVQWQQLAQQRQWAKLFEKIYSDTDIENRLSKLDQMQSLAKYRQIGNFALDYLYKNDSTLEDFSQELTRLSNSAVEDEGALVAKGTDFDCVQIMTIHASKGLEFPVVICAGGFKGKNNKIKPGYLFHDENNKAKLGFSKHSKDKMFKENDYEWQRLFYVAYTRASALLILPFYDKWEKEFKYLKDNISSLFTGPGKEYVKQIKDNKKKYEELQAEVQKILKELKKIEEEKNPAPADLTEEKQLDVTKKLSDKVPELLLTKHSYSSLSHRKAEAAVTDDTGARTDKDGSTRQPLGLSSIDNSENPVKYTAIPEGSAVLSLEPSQAPVNFPKGKKLGIALHEVFEKADFVKSGSFSDCESAQKDEELCRLASACFERQTFNIPDKDPDHWISYTTEVVWNTLNARLPEITGSSPSGSYFSLKEIDNENRISEAEFNINADFENLDKDFLKNYCNGFMDLVFRRVIPGTGKEVYCIVDWKSDFFEGKDYSNGKELASHTNNRYSIQRVLYSYSLVKWLCSFYTDESDEAVFENHFGGIYYVYVRGAVAGSCSGIYARTWKNWQELEAAFKTIFEEFQIKNARGQ